jgi:hypothetical protein
MTRGAFVASPEAIDPWRDTSPVVLLPSGEGEMAEILLRLIVNVDSSPLSMSHRNFTNSD